MPKMTDDVLRRRLAAHIRRIMDERGWTQAQFGRECGVDSASVSNILSGQRATGLDLFARIRSRLRLDANELLDVDPPKKYFDPAYVPGGAAAAAGELAEIAKHEALPPDVAARLSAVAARLERSAARPRRRAR